MKNESSSKINSIATIQQKTRNQTDAIDQLLIAIRKNIEIPPDNHEGISQPQSEVPSHSSSQGAKVENSFKFVRYKTVCVKHNRIELAPMFNGTNQHEADTSLKSGVDSNESVDFDRVNDSNSNMCTADEPPQSLTQTGEITTNLPPKSTHDNTYERPGMRGRRDKTVSSKNSKIKTMPDVTKKLQKPCEDNQELRNIEFQHVSDAPKDTSSAIRNDGHPTSGAQNLDGGAKKPETHTTETTSGMRPPSFIYVDKPKHRKSVKDAARSLLAISRENQGKCTLLSHSDLIAKIDRQSKRIVSLRKKLKTSQQHTRRLQRKVNQLKEVTKQLREHQKAITKMHNKAQQSNNATPIIGTKNPRKRPNKTSSSLPIAKPPNAAKTLEITTQRSSGLTTQPATFTRNVERTETTVPSHVKLQNKIPITNVILINKHSKKLSPVKKNVPPSRPVQSAIVKLAGIISAHPQPIQTAQAEAETQTYATPPEATPTPKLVLTNQPSNDETPTKNITVSVTSQLNTVEENISVPTQLNQTKLVMLNKPPTKYIKLSAADQPMITEENISVSTQANQTTQSHKAHSVDITSSLTQVLLLNQQSTLLRENFAA